jgi:hypothetical protein
VSAPARRIPAQRAVGGLAVPATTGVSTTIGPSAADAGTAQLDA